MTFALACFLTVLIETPVFWIAGFRKRDELTVVVCANVVTNLLLNLIVALFLPERGAMEYALEAAVVASEFGIYAAAFGASGRLLLLTLAANCLSYGAGLLLFS